jgi:hypothetical protein
LQPNPRWARELRIANCAAVTPDGQKCCSYIFEHAVPFCGVATHGTGKWHGKGLKTVDFLHVGAHIFDAFARVGGDPEPDRRVNLEEEAPIDRQ